MISYLYFNLGNDERKKEYSNKNISKKDNCKKLCDSEVLNNFKNIWFREQCYKKCHN